MSGAILTSESALGAAMFPDDLPLCGICGLDEITHDQTTDHDFNAVGGGRRVPRPFSMSEIAPPSRLRKDGKLIVALCVLGWTVIVALFYAALVYLAGP